MKFKVSNLASSQSLEDYLLKGRKLRPRAALKKAFLQRKILVNGKIAKRALILNENDSIEILDAGFFEHSQIQTIVPNPGLKLEVILETPDFVIVNKPAGIHSHPLRSIEKNTALNAVVAKFPKASVPFNSVKPLEGGLGHRLDQGTSGCLFCALNKKTYNAFKDSLQSGEIEKVYLAWVIGKFSKKGTFELFLHHHKKNKKKMEATETEPRITRSWPSKTSVMPVSYSEKGNATLIAIQIHTGVTHQIRVSFEFLGHSILGDSLYSGKKEKPVEFAPLSESTEKLLREVIMTSGISANNALEPKIKKLEENQFFLHSAWLKCAQIPALRNGCFARLPEYFLS